LTENSLHEITIVNNSGNDTEISFSRNYSLIDEDMGDAAEANKITIASTKTAHFYCTAILYKGNLIFNMRTGSQDSR
jgi:hypothetical protein